MNNIAIKLGEILCARHETVATAESCTGGSIAATFTDIPGSSEWFMGAFVTYANEWKMKCLDVQAKTLETYGAVSEQTVKEMLEGLLKNGGTTYGIAVSGIAGPGGGTPEKPVGTVYIGVASQSQKIINRCHFDGDRTTVRNATVSTSIQMLINLINS